MVATTAAPAAAKKKTPLLPKTLQERALLDEVLEVPATLDEYFDLLPGCEYRMDYSDGKIITMGYASITHEALVMRIGHLLNLLFGIDGPYQVLGSNVSTFIPDAQAVHNPDVVVLQGKPRYYVHQGKKRKVQTLVNPFLIVEVLSKATARFDLGIKLPRYKSIPSVQHILVVSQHAKSVSLYSRTNRPNQWLNVEVNDTADGYVTIERKKLRLADIYKNIEEA